MKKKQLPLAFWIFVGLVAGIAAGLVLIPVQVGDLSGLDIAKSYIKPVGTIFLNLLKFVVVPIVLFSIASGVISMQDVKTLVVILFYRLLCCCAQTSDYTKALYSVL